MLDEGDDIAGCDQPIFMMHCTECLGKGDSAEWCHAR